MKLGESVEKNSLAVNKKKKTNLQPARADRPIAYAISALFIRPAIDFPPRLFGRYSRSGAPFLGPQFLINAGSTIKSQCVATLRPTNHRTLYDAFFSDWSESQQHCDPADPV